MRLAVGATQRCSIKKTSISIRIYIYIYVYGEFRYICMYVVYKTETPNQVPYASTMQKWFDFQRFRAADNATWMQLETPRSLNSIVRKMHTSRASVTYINTYIVYIYMTAL